MASFERIIRFADRSGKIFYGEIGNSPITGRVTPIGHEVPIYSGAQPWSKDFALTQEKRTVEKILSPLAWTPLFMCVGLNYKAHAREAGHATPAYPATFIKPSDALAGPFDEIEINAECFQMDYEAELCVVIGKDCKNVKSDEDVWQYVLGFTAGNDLSSRYWQAAERSSGQHGSGKWFDNFAPIGPALVATSMIKDVEKLRMRSLVNGQERQSTLIGDMIFDIPSLIRHMSRGLTLRAGTVIMTGTPSGVGAFQKPPAWLIDGDFVEIEVEGIGRMGNRIRIDRD